MRRRSNHSRGRRSRVHGSGARSGPLGWRATFLRNLLRPIDGLVLYLVGFIVICVSPRRQRIGNRVAVTIVVRRAVQAASPTATEKL